MSFFRWALQGTDLCDICCAAEVCRFGGAQLHCMGAIMGGIASQEAIKLITGQFVPLSGVLIYNAISSTTSVFHF